MKIKKPLTTATITYIFQSNINFSSTDLLTLALYLECDEKNLGFELNYLRDVMIIKKGISLRKKNQNKSYRSVYNQMSFLLKINETDTRKIKVFTGGKIAVCGCKKEQDVNDVYNTFLSILNDFKVDEKVEIYPLGSLIVDKKNLIFNSKQKIIGLIDKKTKVYLKGEYVLPILHNTIECWITSKFNSEHKKNIYDSDGEIISYIPKPLKKQEEIITYVKDSDIKLENVKEKIYFDFKDKILSAKLDKITISIFNKTYSLDTTIDKRKLNDILIEKKYHTGEEVSGSSKLKFFYYFGENSINGRCDCKNHKIEDKFKCLCERATILISGNGTILLFGLKSEKHLIVHDFINNLLDNM